MTPIVAAGSRSTKFPVIAKTTPARSIRSIPAISVRRLPNLSTGVVKPSEIAVSPSSVSVRSSPTRASESPTATR